MRRKKNKLDVKVPHGKSNRSANVWLNKTVTCQSDGRTLSALTQQCSCLFLTAKTAFFRFTVIVGLVLLFYKTIIFLVRPKTIVFGRTSVLRMMFFYFFFIQREISEMRGPTGLKFCTMVEFYNAGPKFFLGGAPQKNFGAKNMQNLARFRTTSKFGGEYLRNGCRCSKSDSHSVYGDSSCVTPLKRNFRKTIFRPLGGAALPNFYTR